MIMSSSDWKSAWDTSVSPLRAAARTSWHTRFTSRPSFRDAFRITRQIFVPLAAASLSGHVTAATAVAIRLAALFGSYCRSHRRNVVDVFARRRVGST